MTKRLPLCLFFVLAACSPRKVTKNYLHTANIPAPIATSAEPSVVEPEAPSEFSIVAEAELGTVNVSLLEGATFLHCDTPSPHNTRMYDHGPRKADPISPTEKAVRVKDDGTLDEKSVVEASAVYGHWPKDAWRLNDSTGERSDYTQRYARWLGDHWETAYPSIPIPNTGEAIHTETKTLALHDWAGGHLFVSTSAIYRGEVERACVFSSTVGNAKYGAPDWSPLCQRTKPKGDTLLCKPQAYATAALPGGDVVVVGSFCGRKANIELAWWKPSRGLAAIAIPGLPLRPKDYAWASASVVLVSPTEAYVGGLASADAPEGEQRTSAPFMVRCDGDKCAPIAQPKSEGDSPVFTLLRGEGAVFAYDGGAIHRRTPSGEWAYEPLPKDIELGSMEGGWPPVLTALDAHTPYGVVKGKLFARAKDGTWQHAPLPRHEGHELLATRVVTRGDDVWVTASYSGTECRRGTVLLRRAPAGKRYYCADSQLSLNPPSPARSSKRVVLLNAIARAEAGKAAEETRRELASKRRLEGTKLVLFEREGRTFIAAEVATQAEEYRFSALIDSKGDDTRIVIPLCAKESEVSKLP